MRQTAELFVDCRAELGEGAFWHPFLARLFWFDILSRTLFSAGADGTIVDRIVFPEIVSAAGVIDSRRLAIASTPELFEFDLENGERRPLARLTPEDPVVRSNDGRVNPAGGFWIGTMAHADADRRALGALYQVREGVVTTLLTNVHIPNAACFAPGGRRAYFADSAVGIIRTVPLDPETGLPTGPWTEFADASHPGVPDGAVVDAEGFLWNARWDGGCVIRFAPDGRVDRIVDVPVSRPTCPAFGGKDLRTLYITSAHEGMTPAQRAAEPHAGSVFAVEIDVSGQPEALFKPIPAREIS